MRIRRATADDAHGIAEVHVASWRWAYRHLLPEDFLGALSVEQREARWARGLEHPAPGSGCVVAEEEGRIVGFAGFGPPEDDPSIRVGPWVVARGPGEIQTIYLLEEVQGTGMGRALFDAAEEGLRSAGYRTGMLWVLEANALARRFYEKAGWVFDGTVSEHRFDCANLPIVRYVVDL